MDSNIPNSNDFNFLDPFTVSETFYGPYTSLTGSLPFCNYAGGNCPNSAVRQPSFIQPLQLGKNFESRPVAGTLTLGVEKKEDEKEAFEPKLFSQIPQPTMFPRSSEPPWKKKNFPERKVWQYDECKQDEKQTAADESSSIKAPFEMSVKLGNVSPDEVLVVAKTGLLKLECQKETPDGQIKYVYHEQTIPKDVPVSALKASLLSDGVLKVSQEMEEEDKYMVLTVSKVHEKQEKDDSGKERGEKKGQLKVKKEKKENSKKRKEEKEKEDEKDPHEN